MARKVLAWLVVFGLVGPAAGAREVQDERLPEDLPDNMDAFRRTPQTDDTPVTPESEEGPGVGGSGTAGTGEPRRDAVEPAEQAPAGGKSPGQKQGVEQPEAPER
ncbi:hypothetical protein [Archangium sp.]|jgi:hypothetical protein|uniref:hypothetical protein n=1 Tax=Archangium sp. TaxID=1872627 RepID=UPI002ED8F431